VLFLAGCQNPFSPKLDFSDEGFGTALSDQTTVEGVFQNFQYSYTFKDTTIYGQLLTHDFIFTYLDPDQGFTVAWGRDEEMKTTYGLLQNSQRLDLIWNDIISSFEDSTSVELVRSFNLTITFNPTDVVRLDGRARFVLNKNPFDNKWRISVWDDKMNF
jgi:hypothetical protein